MTRPRKILVTGADGFIGSHLTEALVAAGHDVRAFVCYNSFNSWGWLDTLPAARRAALDVFSGDIRDPYGVRQAIKGCDVVLHLAALIAIPFSYHSPSAYVDTNINGTLNVLQAARDLGVSRIVQTSTSEVYGTARYVPITEDHPLVGQSPYAATKIAADQMALAFHRSFGVPVTVLRPFNTYGPRQSARAVIPTIITQIVAGERRIRLGAIRPTRDFSYIADTVAGFMGIMDCDAALGEIVNIGAGFEISIGETVALVAEVMGVKVEVVTEEQRQRPVDSEVERLYAGIGKAHDLFGFSPRYGGRDGFRRGLEQTVEWFAKPDNHGRYKHDTHNI